MEFDVGFGLINCELKSEGKSMKAELKSVAWFSLPGLCRCVFVCECVCIESGLQRTCLAVLLAE